MHTIVIDLGFGDSGKGTIVDALARNNPDTVAVVRFCGGAQAQHNVVTDDGLHHTFSQFGSATFVPGVRTHLSQLMMVNPGNLFREEQHLREVGVEDAFERLSIHPWALIITPWHQRANKIRALQLGDRDHGTTGQGIGETMKDSLTQPREQVLRAADLVQRPDKLTSMIARIRNRKLRETPPTFTNANDLNLHELEEQFVADCLELVSRVVIKDDLQDLASEGDLIFEGAQGVLLDQDHGFHPHTTWTRTTRGNAIRLLNGMQSKTIGVLRTYQTRHGAGPFVTEHEQELDEPHNGDAGWAGKFRTGPLDLVALRYAMSVAPINGLAVTHMDRFEKSVQVCDGYTYEGTMQDLAPYFELDRKGIIRNIKKTPDFYLHPGHASHAHMEAVTNRLWDMKPVLTTYAKDVFLDVLQEKLAKPVLITSESPAFAGKKFLFPVVV